MIGELNRSLEQNPFANLTTLVPDWGVSSAVTAFSTTRLGGVSPPPFDSLNLGLHVGDDHSNVLENRRRLQDSLALPSEPMWLNQTHSATMVQVKDAQSALLNNEADGAWTQSHDTVIAVMTADCLPVVISDSSGTRLAVVHAGWRGLAEGILDNALSVFPKDATLHAWLGPAIGPQHFEVGEEVRKAFLSRRDSHDSAFVKTNQKGKYLANLYAIATSELQTDHDVSVSGGEYCTYEQQQWFHSHRRDGKRSGRMVTVAWIGATG